MDKLNTIIKEFKFDGNLNNIKENNQGNINSTYMLTGNDKKYLIQKINSYVFKEPYLVMKNIELVTSHITKKLEEANDSKHKTLKLIKTLKERAMYTYTNMQGEKEYYRAYEYIDNCLSYNTVKESNNPIETAYNAGKCLGFFHKLLDDFPTNLLADTIPNFHNTPNRYKDLLLSIQNKITKRAYNHPEEIVDLLSKIDEYSIIWEYLDRGSIPLRVTHNDTKLNNVLIDEETNEAIAMIDLDTVMPGSILFDIGDGIRSVCANSFEDETDKSKIYLDMDLTKAYLKGYIEEMADYLTKEEVNYIATSIGTLTYELTIRFLTDYINGDTYFKIKYEEHNRDRFLNQYTLLQDVEEKTPEINKYVKTLYKTMKTK